MSFNSQDFPLSFPTDLANDFWALGKRNFMTPTHFSSLVMLPVLPASSSVIKDMPLKGEGDVIDQKLWFLRSIKAWRPESEEEYEENYAAIERQINSAIYSANMSHTFQLLSVNGLETLEAKPKPNTNVKSNQYEISFCGNGQDAMWALEPGF